MAEITDLASRRKRVEEKRDKQTLARTLYEGSDYAMQVWLDDDSVRTSEVSSSGKRNPPSSVDEWRGIQQALMKGIAIGCDPTDDIPGGWRAAPVVMVTVDAGGHRWASFRDAGGMLRSDRMVMRLKISWFLFRNLIGIARHFAHEIWGVMCNRKFGS